MASSSSSSPEISAATTSSIPSTQPESQRFSYKHATHDEVMEDLSSRFILNLPDEELASLERICFQVEQAHWFYEDFIREENPKFPSLPLKKFSAMLFHACPLLQEWSHDHEIAFNRFMQYKTRVPVCGAIMLNDTWEKCVLVKGWKSSSGWGFPKGKINEDEPEPNCAIREVLEETGYNLAGQLNPTDVIEMSIKEQKISLYIVPNVPEDYEFKTKTRKEISKIEWFRLTDLPTWKRNKQTPGKFYLISPFIGPLKQFIYDHKPRNTNRRNPKNVPRVSMLTPPPDVIYSDGHAQESSSQSSSADNGEPQTPSPQYSEPALNIVNGPHIVGSKKEPEMFDPHFARLLNSLTLSATKGNQPEKSTTLAAVMEEPLREPSTPVPVTTSSKPDSISDQDASAPKIFPVTEAPDSPSIPISPQFQSQQFVYPPSASDNSLGPSSSDATSNVPSSITVSPRRGLTSRRSSSTTDLSPYLSRPDEMAGRRLKQLALLESVVDESAKMTPHVGRGELPFMGHSNEMNPGLMGVPKSHFVPTPPASVPPLGDPSDPRVIYSSGLNGPIGGSPNIPPFSSATSAHLMPFHPADPFQIRSHTSLSFHRANANTGANQNQLLAMFNGPRTPVVPGPGVFTYLPNGMYPPLSSIPPYATPRAVQVPANGAFLGFQTGMRYFPPSPASAGFSPGAPPVQSNGQLLSILNSGPGDPYPAR